MKDLKKNYLGIKMKKIISKIEGEATLKIKGEKVVEWVYIEFWQYRGIEEYLINRPFMDALVINPRICGICGHSHLFATVRAIEDLFNAKISKKAEILRNITLSLEIIQNHIKWFYITLFPTQIKDNKYTFKAVKFSSKIAKAIALIAGQFPHSSYMIPGGVTCDITNLELIKLQSLITEIYEDYQKEIIDLNLNSVDLNLFFENLPKEIGKSLNSFLVLGDNGFFKSNGDVNLVSEEKSNSFAKNAYYDSKCIEVGPLARMVNDKNIYKIYQKYGDSIYTRITARLYEGVKLLEYILNESKNIDLSEPSFIDFEYKDGEGISKIEAPRGSLIHKIEIKDKKITNYNIIVPTQFNLSSSTPDNPSPAQKAILGEKVEYVDSIFKCFDICAVCMTH